VAGGVFTLPAKTEGVRLMALLTATSVTSTATAVTAVAVASSDTIAAADIGVNGALLNVINGSGGSINVTLSDPGTTGVGNAAGGGEQRRPVVPAVAAARQLVDRCGDCLLFRHVVRDVQAHQVLRGRQCRKTLIGSPTKTA
jgi:hypothetical protein